MRVGGAERGQRRDELVTVLVDGEPVSARAGQSVAGALLAAGRRTLRPSPRTRAPRGLFCAMGACYECLVTIDGRRNRRACVTLVREGLRIELDRELGREEGR